MPVKDMEKRKLFVEHYVQSGQAKAAAIAAGVPEKSAAVVGCRWLKSEEVIQQIREQSSVFLTEMAPIALTTLKELIEDPDTPASTRLQASRDILDRSGLIPPKRSEMTVNVASRKITELTREELEAIAAGGAVGSAIQSDEVG